MEEALAVVAFSETHSLNQQTQDSVEGLLCLEVLQMLKTKIQVVYLELQVAVSFRTQLQDKVGKEPLQTSIHNKRQLLLISIFKAFTTQ